MFQSGMHYLVAVSTFASERPARDVADCVAMSFEETGASSDTYVRPWRKWPSIKISRMGNTLAAVDVLERLPGSEIVYYRGNIIGSNAKFMKLLEGCK